MDINEAIKILKTELQCLEFQVTGVAQCLDKDCDDCKYKPVSFGKQIECHKKVIECLEAWDKIRAEIDNINLNEVATKYDDRFYGFQREAIKIIDKYKTKMEID